ncbi:hypothetical protein [Aurantiacibacter gilvus]|uniref:Uncharacterized protein n=1 Tax=Aurantiacibacter gilvus TaxID=3139141 RepID=A0ABU9IF35_9SPHN
MIYAAAASEAPTNQFGYLDGGRAPAWETIAAFGLAGLLFLPLALVIVWLFHRFGHERSLVFNATIAAFGSIAGFGAIRFTNLVIFQNMEFSEAAAAAIHLGSPLFRSVLVVIFAMSWLGALLLARRLRRRAQPQPVVGTFE